MNQTQARVLTQSQPLTNKVLRNAYILLALMLGLAATTAFLARNTQPLNVWLSLILIIGAPFLVQRLSVTALGIPAALAYGAMLGWLFGPLINFYAQINPSIVINAFGGTAIATFGLSMYALTTRKDFSFLGGILVVGVIAVIAAAVANIFFQVPALSLAISAVVVVLSSIGILYHTSSAINGGDTNYISVATGLFADIFSMFISLLRLFGFLSSE
jgi:modulator of FtsH protease